MVKELKEGMTEFFSEYQFFTGGYEFFPHYGRDGSYVPRVIGLTKPKVKFGNLCALPH